MACLGRGVERLEDRRLLAGQVVGEYSFEPMVGESIGYDVVVQGDGKAIAVGVTAPAGGDSDVLVLRYGTDGRYDTTFGSFGVTTIDVGVGDVAYGVALSGDKIVVAGETRRGSKRVGLVARLNGDGSRDASFGVNGVVTFALDRKLTRARDVAVWGEKILVAGSAGDNVMLVRFNAEGTFDSTFSSDGVDVRDFGGVDGANSLHIGGSDGRILIGGSTSGVRGNDIALLRYRVGGKLDRRFSDDGVQVMDFARGVDRANAVSVDDAGQIVFAGTVGEAGYNYATMGRLHASGRIDRTFGKRGWFRETSVEGELFSFAQMSNGNFGVGGARLPLRREWTYWAVVGADGTDLSQENHVFRFDDTGRPIYGLALIDDEHPVWAGGMDALRGADPDVGHVIFYRTHLGDGEQLVDVLAQPDGKLVMLAKSRDAFLLTRLNPNGSLDPSFGRGGRAMAFMPRTVNFLELARVTRLIETDGKLLVLGNVTAGSSEGPVFARFSADGTLDESLGERGVGHKFITDDYYPTHVAVQSDGKILVAGGIENGNVVARLNADGSTDTSFSDDGLVYPGGEATLTRMVLGNNQKILLSGWARTPADPLREFFDMRLLPNGSLDTTFDGDGIRITQTEPGTTKLIDPLGPMQWDGSFLANQSETSLDLVRHRADGSLDGGFGTGGHARLDVGGEVEVVDKAVRADGKIVVVGEMTQSNGKKSVVVARFNANGTIDQGFGGGDGWDAMEVESLVSVARVQMEAGAVTVVVQKESGGTGQRFVGVRFGM